MNTTTLILTLCVLTVVFVVVIVALIDVCVFAVSKDEIYLNEWCLGGICEGLMKRVVRE